MTPLLVALGGGLGAVVRFMIDGAIARRNHTGFPLGTLTVNVTGSFLIGIVLAWTMQDYNPHAITAYALLAVGFLGGYTTFSAASVEGVRLMEEGRWFAGISHALGMLLVCYAAAFTAFMIGVGLWGD